MSSTQHLGLQSDWPICALSAGKLMAVNKIHTTQSVQTTCVGSFVESTSADVNTE